MDTSTNKDEIYIWLEHHPTECWAISRVLYNEGKEYTLSTNISHPYFTDAYEENNDKTILETLQISYKSSKKYNALDHFESEHQDLETIHHKLRNMSHTD